MCLLNLNMEELWCVNTVYGVVEQPSQISSVHLVLRSFFRAGVSSVIYSVSPFSTLTPSIIIFSSCLFLSFFCFQPILNCKAIHADKLNGTEKKVFHTEPVGYLVIFHNI